MTVLVLCVCEVCQGAIKRLRPFDSVRSSMDGLCIEPYVKQLAVACILSKLYSVSSIETFAIFFSIHQIDADRVVDH